MKKVLDKTLHTLAETPGPALPLKNLGDDEDDGDNKSVENQFEPNAIGYGGFPLPEPAQEPDHIDHGDPSFVPPEEFSDSASQRSRSPRLNR